MTALELISLANQVLFVGLFVVVLWHAIRQPSRAAFDTVLLFGAIAMAVLVSQASDWLGIEEPWLTSLLLALLNVAPFAMIRLVDDFSRTPRWVQVAGAVAFAGVAALSFVAFEARPELVELVLIGWFVTVGGYAAFAFARAAARSRGITRTRMTAVAAGAIAFIGAMVALLVGALLRVEALSILGQVAALTAVLAFFLGFAPPASVRRAWREPDLRHFLERSLHLAGVDDEGQAVVQLQAAAAAALGASGCSIGIAGAPGVLRYLDDQGGWVEAPDDSYIGGLAFSQQRIVVAADAGATDPKNADVYRTYEAGTVLAAPITTEERRIGVLSVWADRAPVFVEDDLWLLGLMADQAAVLLEARALSAEASSLRSREEAARLKEEFLSAAAHDLRTPLTVVLGQAELLERRVTRDPSSTVDAAGISRMAREARRLRDLVSELLDAQRLEQGAAVMDRTATDLRSVVESVQLRLHEQGLDVKMTLPDIAVVSAIDRMRIEQVLDNLVENAIKYATDGHLPEVQLDAGDDEARMTIVDHGLGIPDDERERIFERFYRASNVQSITDTGMGLGLYICRQIVEAHSGRVWVEPTPGGGSTFIVTLPTQPSPAATGDEATPAWTATGAEATADA